ncbi:MAG: 30S ribosomal protein S20 [Candidatus Omnitrophota bacterium]|nr:MAG: 30S ribosomal protein S20 [Candidatus Omnitrophota bacterium]
MPQRLSGKKELRKTKKRRQRNLDAKERVKSTIKKLKVALEKKDFATCEQALKDVYKTLDRVAAKGLIHPNKAARKKRRIVKLLNKAKAKPRRLSH